jgi:hypothetical protein
MPNNGNTEHENAAQLTANLVDHGHTPDRISDAVLETLIEMSAESQIDIWHRETGLSVASLAALYRLYETGAGIAALDSMPIMKLEERKMTGNHK